MPSTITHAFMAYDIYDRLDLKIKNKFKNKIDEYIIYSQGFDILFFYPMIPLTKKSIKIRKLASIAHRTNVNKFFLEIIKNIKQDKDFDKFIYLAGLVTHYAGDTICHPYVNYLDNKLEHENNNKKDYHFLIEAYIDNYVLRKKGIDYKKYKCYKLMKIKKNKKIIEMLNNSFFKVFDIQSIGYSYFKSINNMKFLYYLIRYDPYKIKRFFYCIIYFILPFLRRDIRYFSYNFKLDEFNDDLFLNLNNNKWYNIRKKELISNKSFLDLYEESVNKSVYMINKLYKYIYENEYLELDKFFGNISYANGLKIINK